MNKKKLTYIVRNFLDGRGYHYEYDAEDSIVRMGFNLNCRLKDARVIMIIRDAAYSVLTICPISADKDNPVEMMKYLTRANYGLINGNFEMDLNDGEIRYKSYVNVDGIDTLSEAIIDWSLSVGIAMMNRYGDGIAMLALGFSDAETEFKKVQDKQE